MVLQLKRMLKKVYSSYKTARNTHKFRADMKKKIQGGGINLVDLSATEQARIRAYWKAYGIKPDINTYQWYKSVTGVCDPRFIPEDVYVNYIMPITNNDARCHGVNDKNLFHILFHDAHMPEALIHCVNGVLLDRNFNVITEAEAVKLVEGEKQVVIKPSVDSAQGKNVLCINSNELVMHMNKFEKDFVVQKIVKQHPILAQLNESSVNVVRITTYMDEDDVKIIDSIIRIGSKDQFTDHFNVAIGVSSDGILNQSGVMKDGSRVTELPNGLTFGGLELPAYKKMCDVAKKMHPRIGQALIVGWDITADENGEVVIIEANLQFPGIIRSQECNGPLFGDLTESLLSRIFER